MWLFKSSIGRKFIMAVTGLCLVLFVTFHVLMNSVALIWPTAYNSICEFLGANWYALVASMGLAALFIIHILYAVWLTLQNRAARGSDRYAVTSRPPQVEWSSKNMLVLGIVIVAFLAVHLIQFWAKMQWVELRGADISQMPEVAGAPAGPVQGTMMLQLAFSCIWTPIIYIIGFIALWFHMTHGFWSMFQTVGWDNKIWLSRLKSISCWWTTIVVLLFVAQAVVFSVQAHRNFFIENVELQEQYSEYWNEEAKALNEEFMAPIEAAQAKVMQAQMAQADLNAYQAAMNAANEEINAHVAENGQAFIDAAALIEKAYSVQCSKMPMTQDIMQMKGIVRNVQSSLPQNEAIINQPIKH